MAAATAAINGCTTAINGCTTDSNGCTSELLPAFSHGARGLRGYPVLTRFPLGAVDLQLRHLQLVKTCVFASLYAHTGAVHGCARVKGVPILGARG
eukprot:139686-Rhodomonas_salina.1